MDLKPPNYWSEKRIELSKWFKRNAPSLGELYEGALRMVFDESFPGRVRFVAHAVREIRNQLPDVIAGPVGSNLQYKNRLDDIANAWQKEGLPLDGSLPVNVTAEKLNIGRQEVPISVKVYIEIAKLIRDHLDARKRPKDEARRLFQAIDPRNKEAEPALRPIIENWIKVTEWFVKRVHDSGVEDVKRGAQQLKERFEIFERALFAIVGEFFKTVEELDAILEEANS
jgi:hypothetical protein